MMVVNVDSFREKNLCLHFSKMQIRLHILQLLGFYDLSVETQLLGCLVFNKFSFFLEIYNVLLP